MWHRLLRGLASFVLLVGLCLPVARAQDRIPRAAEGSDTNPATDLASLRLCVEAVDMMLSSQRQLCKALSEISGG